MSWVSDRIAVLGQHQDRLIMVDRVTLSLDHPADHVCDVGLVGRGLQIGLFRRDFHRSRDHVRQLAGLPGG
jgi:hypothetical protein